MYYANIKYNDIANGLGTRTTLFVSGCDNACPGCFNKEAWDFNYGRLFTEKTKIEIIDSLRDEYISGLTILGGEPLDGRNIDEVLSLVRLTRILVPNKNIWCYTGYELEDLTYFYKTLFIKRIDYRTKQLEELLKSIDVLVDGPFIEAKHSIKLNYRGSSNQRIIDMKETIKKKKIVTLDY